MSELPPAASPQAQAETYRQTMKSTFLSWFLDLSHELGVAQGALNAVYTHSKLDWHDPEVTALPRELHQELLSIQGQLEHFSQAMLTKSDLEKLPDFSEFMNRSKKRPGREIINSNRLEGRIYAWLWNRREMADLYNALELWHQALGDIGRRNRWLDRPARTVTDFLTDRKLLKRFEEGAKVA